MADISVRSQMSMLLRLYSRKPKQDKKIELRYTPLWATKDQLFVCPVAWLTVFGQNYKLKKAIQVPRF